MAGEGKRNDHDRKKAGKPQEPKQPAAGKPTAPPATVLAEDIDTGQKALTILAPGPAKPSEEAEVVRAFLDGLIDAGVPMDGLSHGDTTKIALAVVRRFPGLTRKPGVPRPVREDALLAKRGRLPDGSVFLAVWDEAAGVWAGQLVTKPAVGLAGMLRDVVLRSGEHHATSWPGLFGLAKKLDGLYRAWLARQGK